MFLGIVGSILFATDKFICDQPQNGHECNYSNDQLQQAFDEAGPGDMLYLQAGHTYTGAFIIRNPATPDLPITVTTSKVDWLPEPYSRITPSHLPNIATLQSNVTNGPALSGALTADGRAPAHWHFVGVGFRADTIAQFDNSIIHTAGMDVNGWTIADASQLPAGLIFDRIFVAGRYDDSLVMQNGVRLNGTGLVLENSFVWPLFCAGIECHAVSTQTNPGPLTVTNNFLSAGSIPLITGGSDPDYVGASVPANVTLRYNYLFRPLKWWSNPDNPDRAYFLKNGSLTPCTKNLLEFKAVDSAMVEYNVHENIWAEGYCFGQWFGFAVTPRQTLWESQGSGGNWGYSLGMEKLTTTGNRFSWTGAVNIMRPGQNICVEDNHSGPLYDCHKIETVDNIAKKGTVETPFVLTANQSSQWAWVSDDTPMLRDLTMQHEVFRNAAGGFNMLARDRGSARPGGDEGRVIRLTIRNTLLENTLDALGNTPALRFYPQDVQSTVDPANGGRDIVFEHNTFAWKNPAYNVMYFSADSMSVIAKIKNLSIRSNIFPDTAVQPDGNIYALGASALRGNDWTVIEQFASGQVNLTNNQFQSVADSGCKLAVCSANFSGSTAKNVRFLPNTYKIAPGSALYKAGHDGADVGVDYDSLPLVSNLKVSAADTTAVLEFDLAEPIGDAKKSQPCVLEVSPDENLHSYLGPYAVVNDLNPTYFRQADASSRSTPALLTIEVGNNRHVRWPLGQNQVVTGDDGIDHDLRYQPETNYWGRLMCYGDTRTFSFTTTKATDQK